MTCNWAIITQRKGDQVLAVLILKMDNIIIIQWEEKPNQKIKHLNYNRKAKIQVMLLLEEDHLHQYKMEEITP
jgi:hypothetical protein